MSWFSFKAPGSQEQQQQEQLERLKQKEKLAEDVRAELNHGHARRAELSKPLGERTLKTTQEERLRQKTIAKLYLDDNYRAAGAHNATKYSMSGLRTNSWLSVRELVSHDDFVGRWLAHRRRERAFQDKVKAARAELAEAAALVE